MLQTLDMLKKRDPRELSYLLLALQNIEHFGWEYEKLKPIGRGIKRLRIGRWRILCISNDGVIYVWIIEREKDTEKDYLLWKNYILNLSCG